MPVAGPVAGYMVATWGVSAGTAAVVGAVAQGVVVGAVVGGATAAITGGDIAEGALKGAVIGGVTAGVFQAGSIMMSGAGWTDPGILEGWNIGAEATAKLGTAAPVSTTAPAITGDKAPFAAMGKSVNAPPAPSPGLVTPRVVSPTPTGPPTAGGSWLKSDAAKLMLAQSVASAAGKGVEILGASRAAKAAKKAREEEIAANVPGTFTIKAPTVTLPQNWLAATTVAPTWLAYRGAGAPQTGLLGG